MMQILMEDKEATSFQVLADENFQREAVWKTGKTSGAVKLLSPDSPAK